MTSRCVMSVWGLLALIGAFQGSGVLAAPTQTVGSWTMIGFYRSCSSIDNMCTYAFDVDENTGSDTDRVTCFIDVTGPEETDFSNRPCTPRFVVNAGWDKSYNDGPGNGTGASTPKSFITIVVTDLALHAHAFFAYREDQIGDFKTEAPKLTSPAFTIGTFGDPDGLLAIAPQPTLPVPNLAPRALETADPAERTSREQKSLQILRLNRFWDASFRFTLLSFTINQGNTEIQTCEMRIVDTDPKASWYGRPCGDFTISWGYKTDTDGAVMTVC
ncbi:hypothetical protein B0T25DRAFT_110495 [Lasiosphaeria hispida]|uniref:Uncharacterized protein n=1 Tax=Lasiosphaeria hispida TaxID=260671 RepID=A0AAJ0HQX1_9PEZI|nr:hypothetical protein B0T25DRAFT_110495 [Lasiosphaeria hispida]